MYMASRQAVVENIFVSNHKITFAIDVFSGDGAI